CKYSLSNIIYRNHIIDFAGGVNSNAIREPAHKSQRCHKLEYLIKIWYNERNEEMQARLQYAIGAKYPESQDHEHIFLFMV
ncbi:MAG TPA: hypothetical protein DDY59_07845, partial [Lachnospiraceae bacterium]|nr:hypothetical protein [Lachnospiraceae bacterium]